MTGRNKAETERVARKPSTGNGKPLSPVACEYWNRRYAAKELVWTANANRFLIAEVANLPPGRALDLAAGEGRNAVWLAEQGWHVCAVDFSGVAIEKGMRLAAGRNLANRIDFEIADLRHYKPELGGFDLVALVYLQVPKVELAPIVAQAASAVAPGGVFLLVAHEPSNLVHGYGGPQDANLLYAVEEVLAALDGKLEIEKAGIVERPVETGSGIKVAFDCLVRGKRHD